MFSIFPFASTLRLAPDGVEGGGGATVPEAVATVPDQVATAAPASVDSTPVGQTPPEGQQEQTPPPKTFTQEELDRIVAREKAKTRRSVERDLSTRVSPEIAALTNIPMDQLNDSQKLTLLVEQEAQKKVAQQEAVHKRNDFVDRGIEKYPDFQQVFHDNVAVSNEMAHVILNSEAGSELAYWLGKNPDEARRISTLSPLSQASEMGKIEAKLTQAAPTTPAKTVSSAPAPITPVAATGTTRIVDTTDPRSVEHMSTSEWIEADCARRRENLLARRKR